MDIQKAKPLKWTNVTNSTNFYGIQVMINNKWYGLLDGDQMVKIPTYKEAKEYCLKLINSENENMPTYCCEFQKIITYCNSEYCENCNHQFN